MGFMGAAVMSRHKANGDKSAEATARRVAPIRTRLMEILTAAAEAGETCPSNMVLAQKLRLKSDSSSVDHMAALEREGLIRISRIGHNARVVEIVASGHHTAGPGQKAGWRTTQDVISPDKARGERAAESRRAAQERRQRITSPADALPSTLPPRAGCQWPTNKGEERAVSFTFDHTAKGGFRVDEKKCGAEREGPGSAYCSRHKARSIGTRS